MEIPAVHIGNLLLKPAEKQVSGSLKNLDGELYYKIEHVDELRPFLMSVISDSDHWMFLSSNGALTAGRRDADNALFPYYTEDKIHDAQGITGPITAVHVIDEEGSRLWETFSRYTEGLYRTERSIYKHITGTRVRFEEINWDLGLTYWQEWGSSQEYGFVKKSGLRTDRPETVHVRLLDGIQNLLPWGVDRRLQNEKSNLVDAYKKAELHVESGLGIFSLSSRLVDRPEPAEALKATTVFVCGPPVEAYMLSTRQVASFRKGLSPETEHEVRGERMAYLVSFDLKLAPLEEKTWFVVADVDQEPDQLADLAFRLSRGEISSQDLADDVERGARGIRGTCASADGLQLTELALSDARHFSNVLFNLMRGGVFGDGYNLDCEDFSDFLQVRNRTVYTRYARELEAMSPYASLFEFRGWIAGVNDGDLKRLSDEYLPLSFSRRHGDPSRPWNEFSIQMKRADGKKNLYFEGNWRDIFQNWEALAVSFPHFLPSMVAKFVNASTADGYNPYRITRDGIDWETIDPNDPWSHIGYWGDHQIVYLLRLLELSNAHFPGSLKRMLNERRYSYANVPYRIASYSETLRDPHHTIEYDVEREAAIQRRLAEVGEDGKLLMDADGEILLVGLAEKMLVPVLAKMSNFIPGAGIWMNTQRPEWNDANNALVGNGVSVVTLCYLRRFLGFLDSLMTEGHDDLEVSEEVARLFSAELGALVRFKPFLDGDITSVQRKQVLDALGKAGSTYRIGLYDRGMSGQRTTLGRDRIQQFCQCAMEWIDHTIRRSRKSNGLFHAYNLVEFHGRDELLIERLYDMLEGQVAVLSSGILSAEESVDVLSALRRGSLYRKDQNSYLLYPNRKLPTFLEKNTVPAEWLENIALVERLVGDGDLRLLVRDSEGTFHFSGSVQNAEDVDRLLDELRDSGYDDLVDRDGDAILDVFEKVFNHRAFTGRSGTFFGYEGLGSVYWHMVSKLRLAIAEIVDRLSFGDEDPLVLRKLTKQYFDIRDGLGQSKTPVQYGAFPMDPYSHTPAHGGAQQPGMTGQVKEDILARWHELGVSVRNGCIHFQPRLLRDEEFVSSGSRVFTYTNVVGVDESIRLEKGSLAFTYCQVPIVYHRAEKERIHLTKENGIEDVQGGKLGPADSAEVFTRSDRIKRLDVYVAPAAETFR